MEIQTFFKNIIFLEKSFIQDKLKNQNLILDFNLENKTHPDKRKKITGPKKRSGNFLKLLILYSGSTFNPKKIALLSQK